MCRWFAGHASVPRPARGIAKTRVDGRLVVPLPRRALVYNVRAPFPRRARRQTTPGGALRTLISVLATRRESTPQWRLSAAIESVLARDATCRANVASFPIAIVIPPVNSLQ